uniref:GATA-type domain-containing protein n=1 Tax=Thiomonas intermedia (strain K12) TaxID=75379 RepID=D5X4Y5_THIK1
MSPIFATSKKYACAACGACEFSIYRHVGAGHTGAACADCGLWLKWLSAAEKRALRLPPDCAIPTQPARRAGSQGDLFEEGEQ